MNLKTSVSHGLTRINTDEMPHCDWLEFHPNGMEGN